MLMIGQVFVGAVSGGAAGYVAGSYYQTSVNAVNSQGFVVPGSTTATSAVKDKTPIVPTSTIKLVPISVVDNAPRVVSDALLDRLSPVGTLYAHDQASADKTLQEEEILAHVVALTSDGWFVAPLNAFENQKSSRLIIWYNNKAYPVERAIEDLAVQTVFLKTQATNLSAPSFAQMSGRRTGTAVWFEMSAMQFVPSVIISLRAIEKAEVLLSDKTTRRMLVAGSADKKEYGAPIWDANGALVGLVESSADGRMIVIPAAIISSSLQSLVSSGEIRHAALGVYSVDRSLVRSLQVDNTMPVRGAIIQPEKKNTSAIIKASAAEKAGLKNGDVILQVDRDILDGSSDLGDIILQYRSGATVNFRVWRDGNEIDVPVALGTQVTSKALP